MQNFSGLSGLGANTYKNPFFMIAVSVLGWFMLYSLSYLLTTTKIKQWLILIGRNTLAIVILHFLCMKLIEYFVVIFHRYPLYCLSIFPNLNGDKDYLWIAYTFIGVILPISIKKIYLLIKTNATKQLFMKKRYTTKE